MHTMAGLGGWSGKKDRDSKHTCHRNPIAAMMIILLLAKVASVCLLWLCVIHHSYLSSYIFSDFALKSSLALHKLHQFLLFLTLYFVLIPE